MTPLETPAGRLLLWVARARVRPSAADGPPLELMTDEQWTIFLRDALRHGMVPLAARTLAGDVREPVPAAIRADLQRAAESNGRRSLTLAGELVTVVRLLADAGIRAVPWKGPLLAQRAYGDLGARYFFDLDVLVSESDLIAARDLMLVNGFRTEKHMTAAQQEAYVEHQGELELVRDSDGLWLELHTAIVPTYYSPGTGAEDVWERLVTVRLAGREISALALVDELEALCVHGSKHRWERLIWTVDVGRMAALLTDYDWERLASSARQHGATRMVNLGLLLADELCDAPIPRSVLERARADVGAQRLAGQVTRDLFNSRPARADSVIFHTRMRERARDRAGYLVNVLFRPSGADWETFSLPRALFPLYAVTRPFRLSLKYGRRLLRRRL